MRDGGGTRDTGLWPTCRCDKITSLTNMSHILPGEMTRMVRRRIEGVKLEALHYMEKENVEHCSSY